MRFVLLLTFSFSTFAYGTVTRLAIPSAEERMALVNAYCAAELASREKQQKQKQQVPVNGSAGEMITRLLEERGAALGATNIGLIEVWMKNGETMLSRIYFTTDGSDPISQKMQAEFIARFSKRTHMVNRVNAWKLNLVRGGSVIHSIPVGDSEQ